jgi:hypothetical protein
MAHVSIAGLREAVAFDADTRGLYRLAGAWLEGVAWSFGIGIGVAAIG